MIGFMFIFILGVKKDRVQSIAKYWLENGKARPENRGGPRETEEQTAKKDIVRKHIQSHIQSFLIVEQATMPAVVHLGESSCRVT